MSYEWPPPITGKVNVAVYEPAALAIAGNAKSASAAISGTSFLMGSPWDVPARNATSVPEHVWLGCRPVRHLWTIGRIKDRTWLDGCFRRARADVSGVGQCKFVRGLAC